MSTGDILVNIVNGQRTPFDAATRLLVTATDGQQKTLFRTFVNANTIRIPGLEVRENLADRYTILVSAKDHSDAGFTPVLLKANSQQVVDLMMMRREADFVFEEFDAIDALMNLQTMQGGRTLEEAEPLYERLRQHDKPALACLLNIATALGQITLAPASGLDQNPLRSFHALRSAPERDRLFAWADVGFLEQVKETARKQGDNKALSGFVLAPAGLHPGATVSYKQTDFGEGNVQLSFHEGETDTVNGVACMVVEADIDYFKDTAAHILLEVFPNTLNSKIHGKNSAQSLTNPRSVYGLRWIAGRRLGRDFAPPYVLA
jgi:hypothetical protein